MLKNTGGSPPPQDRKTSPSVLKQSLYWGEWGLDRANKSVFAFGKIVAPNTAQGDSDGLSSWNKIAPPYSEPLDPPWCSNNAVFSKNLFALITIGVHGLAEESINMSLLLCQQVCTAVSDSIRYYISKQPSWSFFEAATVFDPRKISGSGGVTRDISQYKAIPWLVKDMHNAKLLEEWSIYVAQDQAELQQYTHVDSNNVDHFDICRYWIDRRSSLPCLARHALRTLDVPVSSADAERAFSSYNKLVCSSRMSLADESVRVLHSAAWNGDIGGRFAGYDY
jgi:hypothetical protein